MTFRPRYLSTANVPITIELRALPCYWEIRKNVSKRPGQRRCGPRPCDLFLPVEELAIRKESPVAFEPWSLREEFLSLETEADFLGFLNRVGRFAPEDELVGWELNDFKGWQEVFRELLTSPAATWKRCLNKLRWARGFDTDWISCELNVINKCQFYFRFRIEESPHSAVISVRYVAAAILATIYIDHLRGARFEVCNRHDCRKPFEITSNHERKYCDQYCAHLASLRRMRERQRLERRRTGRLRPKESK